MGEVFGEQLPCRLLVKPSSVEGVEDVEGVQSGSTY